MLEKSTNPLIAAIEQQTAAGSQALAEGNLPQAQLAFTQAYQHAHDLGDPYTERACAFNLGALYISAGQAKHGLQFLRCAIPPADTTDGASNGDLFYNFGLGYESLQQAAEAGKYFELALEEYHKEANTAMQTAVATHVGQLYSDEGEWLLAARAFQVAASAHEQMGDLTSRVEALSRQAAALMLCGREQHALQVADRCMVLGQDLEQDHRLGAVYNELGLTYTQCGDFARAATCFELALPVVASAAERRQEAVIRQNLGAAYNSLGDFQRALTFHESAAEMHAELGQRGSQGQCFTNLAYAYSQLGDKESSGECYLHALQAARDTGDTHAQWQSLEGLGAVFFQQGQPQKAASHFKLALATLTSTENNELAQLRLTDKLKEAQQACQPEGASVKILVNDNPRPPTRQESLQLRELRKLRGARHPHENKPVALGVTNYDSDSDRSLSTASMPDGQQIEIHSTNSPQIYAAGQIPRSARPSSAPMHRQNSAPVNGHASTSKNMPRKHRYGIGANKQSFSTATSIKTPKQPLRRNVAPLLRKESHNSEAEWRDFMREITSSGGASEDYNPRFHPPNTSSDEGKPVHQRKNKKKKKKRRKSSAASNISQLADRLVEFLDFDSSAERSRDRRIGARKKSSASNNASRDRSNEREGILSKSEDEPEFTTNHRVEFAVSEPHQRNGINGHGVTSDDRESASSDSDTEESEQSDSQNEDSRQTPPGDENGYLNVHQPSASMMGTYEVPVVHAGRGTGNYFVPGKDEIDTSRLNNGAKRPDISPEEAGDPLYQTIPSLGRTQPKVVISEEPDAPELPPRPRIGSEEFERAFLEDQQRETMSDYSPSDLPPGQSAHRETKTCIIL